MYNLKFVIMKGNNILVKIIHILVLWNLLCEFIFESHIVPANITVRRTLLWVDVLLNTCCGNLQCNIATEAAAFRFRTVLHTRSGRHNCPCPSYTVQNPQKTNTTVCEVPDPVHASEMRINELIWLCYITLVWARACHDSRMRMGKVKSSISR